MDFETWTARESTKEKLQLKALQAFSDRNKEALVHIAECIRRAAEKGLLEATVDLTGIEYTWLEVRAVLECKVHQLEASTNCEPNHIIVRWGSL